MTENMITAKGEEIDQLFAYDLGVDEYITKPFSPKILVAKIKAVLRRGQQEAHPAPEEGVAIDSDAHQVTLDGQTLNLSPTEYKLLNYLMFDWESIPAIIDVITQGLLWTVIISITSIIIGYIIGLATGFARAQHIRFLQTVSSVYVWLIRSTPILVQALYIYFVFPKLFGIRMASNAREEKQRTSHCSYPPMHGDIVR